MKKAICACLALVFCLGLLCAAVPESRAAVLGEVKKNGQEVTSADSLQVNDIVTFGTYPFKTKDDVADIEWIVLELNGTRATLLSRYVLDAQPYHKENEKVSWQTCNLNKWLNSTFRDAAFTAEEQVLINGNITIPSVAEAQALTYDQRKPAFTPYAVSLGGDANRCVWWLRDGNQVVVRDGEDLHCATVVQQGGIVKAAYMVTYHGKGIRPMVQIDFDRWGSDPSSVLYPSEETGLLVKGNQTVVTADELELYDDVTFGAYPQTSYYDEQIHWIVIGKEGDRVRLLSTLALDSQNYHTPYEPVTWENSSLRGWLNSVFMEAAFAPVEQGMLTEEISLLSVDEARALPEELRIADSTYYAVTRGADSKRCIWWLKDASTLMKQDGEMYCASVVLDTGVVGPGYFRVDLGHKLVRPVITIDLSRLPQ